MNTAKRITWKAGPIWRSDVIFCFRCYYSIILSLHFVTFIMLWLVKHKYIYIYIYYTCIYIYIYQEVKHQRFVPTYPSTFMGKIVTNFLDTQVFKLLVWFRYIDDVFFIWTHGKEKLEEFLKDFNNYHLIIKLTHEFNKESIPFLDLKVILSRD